MKIENKRNLTSYSGNEEVIFIPKSTFVVKRGAFKGNTSIREVVFPLNTRIIEAEAFKDCTNLEKVTFLGVEVIGKEAFTGTALTEVSLPEMTLKVSADAFDAGVKVNYTETSFLGYPKLSVTNSKLGAIPSIDLPPITTCRCDAPCADKCYACRGRYVFADARTAKVNNLKTYYADPDYYFNSIAAQIKNGLVSYNFFRWHSTGDIPDMAYIDGMAKVARKVKTTRFLCFTKKYELVNAWLDSNKKPTNLIIVLSNWGDWLCNNPHNLPTAWIAFKNTQTMIPAKAFHCMGSCSECVMSNGGSCFYMKKGNCVVFEEHGTGNNKGGNEND